MRSDKYRGKKSDKKKAAHYNMKKKDTMTEDFLAEFRNMEHNSHHMRSGNDYDDDYMSKAPKKSGKKSDTKNSKKTKPKKVKKKKVKEPGMKKKRRWPKVLIILLLILTTACAGAYFFLDSQVGKMEYIDTGNADLGIEDSVAKDLKGYRNVALLGIDARKGENPANCRTDAIIIMSINKETDDIVLTSVARDTYLMMDSKKGDDMLDKATHAHVFGGPVNTVKMLNQNLDLNIEEFVVMDWEAVADTVDAMGGITVDVQPNEIRDLNSFGPETAENTDREWTPITSTGEQRIDGAQAATYCRIRYNSGGDPGRTDRMKKVVTALLVEAKNHPTKLTKVTDKVLPGIRTNVKTKDILTLLPDVAKMNITDSISYPFDYWGGSFDGSWKAIPTTLESNAVELHEKMFGQTDYEVTNTLEQISRKIENKTGKE